MCGAFAAPYQESCVNGVAMAFTLTQVVPAVAADPSRLDEMLFACDRVGDHVETCLRQIPYGWFELLDGDFAAVAALCTTETASLRPRAMKQCGYGVGFLAGEHSNGVGAIAVGWCTTFATEEMRGWCYGGAAVKAVDQWPAEPGRPASVCEAVPSIESTARQVCDDRLREALAGALGPPTD